MRRNPVRVAKEDSPLAQRSLRQRWAAGLNRFAVDGYALRCPPIPVNKLNEITQSPRHVASRLPII